MSDIVFIILALQSAALIVLWLRLQSHEKQLDTTPKLLTVHTEQIARIVTILEKLTKR